MEVCFPRYGGDAKEIMRKLERSHADWSQGATQNYMSSHTPPIPEFPFARSQSFAEYTMYDADEEDPEVTEWDWYDEREREKQQVDRRQADHLNPRK